MKRYAAILYDIDGTLLNTLDMNLYPLLQIIWEEKGEEWTLEQVYPFFFQPGLKTMEDLGIRDIEKTYARWVSYVNAYEPGAVPYDGIERVLEAFQAAGIRQAVVSSKMRKQYQIDVVDTGLARYLETAVLAEDTTNHKPHPEPILEALRRMGIPARDALYVGDAPSDSVAARNAGVDFGFAQWGSVLEAPPADSLWCFSGPEDLLQLL